MAKSAFESGPLTGGSLSCDWVPGIAKWVILAAVALFLFVALVIMPVDVATVRLPRMDNRLFGAVKTATGGDIRLHYRHSVEKTMVEGRFTVGKGPVLQALETRMTSVGTGLPNTQSQRTRREGKWIVVDEGLKKIPSFDFFLSAINRTRLVVDDIPIPVETLSSGSVIRLDVEKVPLGQWLLWQCLKIDWRKDRQ